MKTFLHDGFGQVYIFSLISFWRITFILFNAVKLLAYSIDEFKIKILTIRHCMFELEKQASLNRQRLQHTRKQSAHRLLRSLSLL